MRDYESPEYKAWRYKIFVRDNFQCQLCKCKNGKLQAHHIVRWADNPKLRFLVTNGITLCEGCHDHVTGKEKDFEDQFKKNVRSKMNLTNSSKKKAKRIKNNKYTLRDPDIRY